MKKAFLISLIAIVSFNACKKPQKEPQKRTGESLHKYMERTWHTTFENKTYYNESNQQLYSEDLDPGVKYLISETQLKRTDENGSVTGTYLLSTLDDKDIVTVSLDGKSEAYELVSIGDSTMVWQQEKANQSFTQDGQEKLAAKEVHVIHFLCPCGAH